MTNSKRRMRRRLAATVMTGAVVLGAAGCLGPAYNSYVGGPYICHWQLGPTWNPADAPVPPTVIRPVLGDLVYEACWIID
ncbi:MAG: hypothetical protein U0Q22_07570 [Acidimicrobiales bacterium]